MVEVPKRPISMFTEDKREKERPLTPVQENDASSSIVENGVLKPVIRELVEGQILAAMKEPNAKIELYQKGMEEKIASLTEQMEIVRNEGAEN